MTVEHLLKTISSEELSEWLAFHSLEPWGEDRADLRAAIGHSLFYNANSKHPKSPIDFMAYTPPKPQQTPEEMRKVIRQLGIAYGAGGASEASGASGEQD